MLAGWAQRKHLASMYYPFESSDRRSDTFLCLLLCIFCLHDMCCSPGIATHDSDQMSVPESLLKTADGVQSMKDGLPPMVGSHWGLGALSVIPSESP